MQLNIYYEACGIHVTKWNYDHEMHELLKLYTEKKEAGDRAAQASYCTELGIQMVRILIMRKLILHTDVVFWYEGQHLRPDKDARIEPWPEGFCDTMDGVLQELLNVQMASWKKEMEDAFAKAASER